MRNLLAVLAGGVLIIVCALADSPALWHGLLGVYGAIVFMVGVIEILSEVHDTIDTLFRFRD